MTTISIANDFTRTPGGRFRKHGSNSGEEFRVALLFPAFTNALERGQQLVVDFDGVVGAPASFLEEAFGGLVRQDSHLDFSKLLLRARESNLLPYIELAYQFIAEAKKQAK